MRTPTDRPLALRADNFTPPTRTPWGGTRILGRYKRGLSLAAEKAAYPVVGEAWEVSVDPAFPSRLVLDTGTERSLSEAIAADPAGMVGPSSARYSDSTPILVKLLDADDELSVQVHPTDAYAGLAPGESGKPESWVIVGAEDGGGLYLGLREGVTREGLADALANGDDLRPMLNFVPVAPGDAFVIAPGTVHAIGRGVTLVEPQLIVPGLSGKTYRFWDWNRTYDRDGRPDPAGQPRELHAAHSLAVTRFDGPRGSAFVAETRAHPTLLREAGSARHERLLQLQDMVVERLSGTGTLTLPAYGSLVAVTAVRGTVALAAEGGSLRARYGTSCVLPAAVGEVAATLEDNAEAILTWIA